MDEQVPPTNSQREVRDRHVLLVEGEPDMHIVGHLYGSRHGTEPPFKIIPEGSAEQVLDMFSLRIKESGRETVGIIVDADQDRVRRWSRVRERLDEASIDVPEEPDPKGTIINIKTPLREAPQLRRVGIWLAPDNNSHGEIENLVAMMIRTDDIVWPFAETYIENVLKVRDERERSKSLSKRDRRTLIQTHRKVRGQVWAWLAARREPAFMGRAIRKGNLDVTVEACRRFTGWIDDLYADAIEASPNS